MELAPAPFAPREFDANLAARIASAWLPPPDLTVSEWADKYRKLSPEASAEPGQWRTSRAEFQRGIMDACSDAAVHTVVIMSSAQVGKTEVINNVVGYHIDYDPCPILVLQPSVKPMAEAWSKDRLAPMVRDTPALKGKVRDAKGRDSANTILHKNFPGGHITVAGANSPASLASRPVRLVLPDEVDRYPPSAGDEGDPVALARKRSTTFWNRLTVITSTPTIKGASRIEHEYELSDKRRFYVPCPHCGESQHLQWKQVVWDDGQPETAKYACEHCGVLWSEAERHRAVTKGEWVATAEFNGRAGFHLNEIYSPWVTLAEMAIGFLEAKKTRETLKTWTNTSLGETWEEKGAEVDAEHLTDLVESYDKDSLPDDILVITAAVDVQGDRLEARSQGWGEEQERWNIEKRVFWGDPSKPAVWKELDEWLLEPYAVAGRKIPIQCTAVDSGGHHTKAVYAFCKPRQRRRVFAVKGSSEYYAPIASKGSQKSNKRVTLYLVGTDTAKDDILLSSLDAETEPGPGYIHFPRDTDEEDFKQLGAEQRKTVIRAGVKRLVWVKVRERNEEIDLHVYNLAAYDILNPDIEAIKRKRAPAPEPEPEPEQAPTTRRTRPARKRRNWATDF